MLGHKIACGCSSRPNRVGVFPSSQQIGGTNGYRYWLWHEEILIGKLTEDLLLLLLLVLLLRWFYCYYYIGFITIKIFWWILSVVPVEDSSEARARQFHFCSTNATCILRSGVTDILSVAGVTQQNCNSVGGVNGLRC